MIDYAYYDDFKRGRVYFLFSDYDFEIDGTKYTIPKGFESDGMSCPKWAWHFFSPAKDLKTLECSIVHDWLYATHTISRRKADIWYRNELEKLGYPISSNLAYIALRLFGNSHW